MKIFFLFSLTEQLLNRYRCFYLSLLLQLQTWNEIMCSWKIRLWKQKVILWNTEILSRVSIWYPKLGGMCPPELWPMSILWLGPGTFKSPRCLLDPARSVALLPHDYSLDTPSSLAPEAPMKKEIPQSLKYLRQGRM
jgi:hypothetical protein